MTEIAVVDDPSWAERPRLDEDAPSKLPSARYLPRNPLGKILKRVLREGLAEQQN